MLHCNANVNENKRTFFRIASSETRSAKAMTNQMATHSSLLIAQSSSLPCHPKNKLLSPKKWLFCAGHSSQNADFIGISLKVINNGGAHDDDLPQLPVGGELLSTAPRRGDDKEQRDDV